MSRQAAGFESETPPRRRHQSVMRTLVDHWPEYAIEGVCLGLFMISAAGFATMLQHPSSPLSSWHIPAPVQRLPMGIAMGLTLMAIVYSTDRHRQSSDIDPFIHARDLASRLTDAAKLARRIR